jgi:hypothetical protein
MGTTASTLTFGLPSYSPTVGTQALSVRQWIYKPDHPSWKAFSLLLPQDLRQFPSAATPPQISITIHPVGVYSSISFVHIAFPACVPLSLSDGWLYQQTSTHTKMNGKWDGEKKKGSLSLSLHSSLAAFPSAFPPVSAWGSVSGESLKGTSTQDRNTRARNRRHQL